MGFIESGLFFLLVTDKAKQTVHIAFSGAGEQQSGTGCVFSIPHMGGR